MQKVLEDANVKIGNVLSDVFGMSGQAMLEALFSGQTRFATVTMLGHDTVPAIAVLMLALGIAWG